MYLLLTCYRQSKSYSEIRVSGQPRILDKRVLLIMPAVITPDQMDVSSTIRLVFDFFHQFVSTQLK